MSKTNDELIKELDETLGHIKEIRSESNSTFKLRELGGYIDGVLLGDNENWIRSKNLEQFKIVVKCFIGVDMVSGGVIRLFDDKFVDTVTGDLLKLDDKNEIRNKLNDMIELKGMKEHVFREIYEGERVTENFYEEYKHVLKSGYIMDVEKKLKVDGWLFCMGYDKNEVQRVLKIIKGRIKTINENI